MFDSGASTASKLSNMAIRVDAVSKRTANLRRLRTTQKVMPSDTRRNAALDTRQRAEPLTPSAERTNGSAARKREAVLAINRFRIMNSVTGAKDPARLASTEKILTRAVNAIEISAVVSRNENVSNFAA